MKYYGADYYPEQLSSDEIAQDIRLMREAGLNVVRMAEFSWRKLEPQAGRFDFGWLEDVVNKSGENGIYSLLCTPSAAPPIWLFEAFPEIAYVDNRGVKRPFGGRRHYCYNSDAYIRYSARIAAELAKRFAGNPYVIGFQIDNEMAQEATGRCCCAACKGRFQAHLRDKYKTIERFNERAGTLFWGQTYESFAQVLPPAKTIEFEGVDLLYPYMDNPTLRLEFERFASDSMIKFIMSQADEMRRHTDKPLMTNTTGIWTSSLNYYKAFAGLDIVATDEYFSLRGGDLFATSLGHAFSRGIKHKNFWVVETTSGGGLSCWAREGTLHPFPGALRQGALQAMVSGAELITYFQFKSALKGAEQFEQGILDIDGMPRRRYYEIAQTAKEIKALEGLLDSTKIKNDIALLFDYDSLWSIAIKPFSKKYYYRGCLVEIYKHLALRNIAADVIGCNADLDALNKYKVIVLPTAAVLSEQFRSTLKEYVKNGGCVAATYYTSIKNDDNNMEASPLPLGLDDLFGARVLEGEPVFDSTRAELEIRLDGRGIRTTNQIWTESVELTTGNAIGVFADTYRKGQPTFVSNRYGKGTAYYLGSGIPFDKIALVLESVCRRCGCFIPGFEPCAGVEVFTRYSDAGDATFFIFNYDEKENVLTLNGGYKDVLTGEKYENEIRLEAKGFAAVRSEDR